MAEATLLSTRQRIRGASRRARLWPQANAGTLHFGLSEARRREPRKRPSFSAADRRPVNQCRRVTREISRRAAAMGGVPGGTVRIHTRRRNTGSNPARRRPAPAFPRVAMTRERPDVRRGRAEGRSRIVGCRVEARCEGLSERYPAGIRRRRFDSCHPCRDSRW